MPSESDSINPYPSVPLRDKVVERTCNWLINHVASKHYRAFIGVSSLWGAQRVREWAASGAPLDDDWGPESPGYDEMGQ